MAASTWRQGAAQWPDRMRRGKQLNFAQVLDGKATAAAIKAELKVRVGALRARGVTPGLGTVLVGDDPGRRSYVNGKHNDCAEVGIESIRERPARHRHAGPGRGRRRRAQRRPGLRRLHRAAPAAQASTRTRVLGLIDPAKDADGLHPANLGRLVLGSRRRCPARRAASSTLLRRHGVPIAGAEVVVVGRGMTVGRPLGLLLTRRSENATVTLCHTGTRDLAAHLRRADIIVAAAGVPGIVTADMVKPGAAVLDVGVSRGRTASSRRRRRRRGGRRGLGLPEPRRRRPDDPRDAARQRRLEAAEKSLGLPGA